MRFCFSLAASALLLIATSSAAATVGASPVCAHAGAPRELKGTEIPGHSALAAQTADVEPRAFPIVLAAFAAINYAVMLATIGVTAAVLLQPEGGCDLQQVVKSGQKKNPAFNLIFVSTEHTVKFAGKNGTDWAHKVATIKPINGTVSRYDIYSFKDGEITLKGDIANNKWAYAGNVTLADQGGKHLVFSAPAPCMNL